MSAALSEIPLPQSMLDTDLYKVMKPPMFSLHPTTNNVHSQLTMQQSVLHLFPDVHATYRFTNRNLDTLFSRQCIERFRTAVSRLSPCPTFTLNAVNSWDGLQISP
jgi:nicotinate phosphoribosyltransferase